MQTKFGSPLKVLMQTVVLLVASYVYGSPAFSSLRPGILDKPFGQFHLVVNGVLRDGKIDTSAPAELIVSTGNSVKRQINDAIGGN